MEMNTYRGISIDPMSIKTEDIDIRDIAHALSNICRFRGHCRKFYSVAEHSIRVQELVPQEHKLQALLHDATEAYLGDVIRPIKLGFKPYVEAEYEAWLSIAMRYRLPCEMHASVKEADEIMLATEAFHLMRNSEDWDLQEKPLAGYPDMKLTAMIPAHAEQLFLETFYWLTSR